MPISGDCVVEGYKSGLTFVEGRMTGGRQSDHRLFVHGGDAGWGYLNLDSGEYRFAGGTEIAGATLVVWDTLVSDVKILRDYTGLGFSGTSELWLLGTVRGNVHNEQLLNVRCWSGIHNCASVPQQRIEGDYTQTTGSSMEIALGRALYVTGTATLAGGLAVAKGDHTYVPPQTPASIQILHADGGVFGTFDGWTSPGLFIEGGLRYASNDVWFDLTRISVQAATVSNGLGSTLTLASAGNIDRALAVFDGGIAKQPDASQRAFLASAGTLLWMHDPAQATRAIDSLSGAIHADALQSTGDGASARTAIGAHLDRVVPGIRLGAWMHEDGNGTISGADQWLGPRLLAGVHASQVSATDTASASATDLAAGGYLRWFGDDGWYAGLDANAGQRTLAVGRTIDFGDAGRWLARSRRAIDAASMSVEAGRRLPMLGGSLTPFVGAGLSTVHAGAAAENGTSGFELQLADARLHARRASAGVRLARDWRWGDHRWLRVQLAAGLDRTAWNGAQRAAFVGVNEATFDLPASATGRDRWTSLGMQGGWGHGWTWNAARSTGHAFGSDQPWQLSIRRAW